MKADFREPIFVIGTGRSGSTVFFEIFAKHPNVAWLSRLADDYPASLRLHSLLVQLRGSRLSDFLLGGHFGPSEAYPFWDQVCPGFSNPYRDLLQDDVTLESILRVRHSISRMVTGNRNRFLAKITGWPRVHLLREIFPHAIFIEVSREPCATATSLLEVPFWDGWRGPPNWRRGPLPADLEAIWREEGESFVALAAIEYVIIQRAMEQARSTLKPEQYLKVSYSTLCADPIAVFRVVAKFCQLEWSKRFERSVQRVLLVDRDDQWRTKLTATQQAVMQRTLERAQAGTLSMTRHE